MKQYEITLYVPREDKPAAAADDGRWLDTGCAFALGMIVMMLVMLP